MAVNTIDKLQFYHL